jgi:hypothetical protein
MMAIAPGLTAKNSTSQQRFAPQSDQALRV